jgi:glycosyltransferase involved in cell wall biosynthesis
MPIVSVVVPFYNQARYLGQSVGSALSQTLSDIEVIVVDDGSAEDPALALRRFENDARLRILRQENGGVANARNTAISASTGEFLHFLDADDWIDASMFAELIPLLRKHRNCGFAYCDVTRVNADGSRADDFTVAGARSLLDGDILPSLLAGGYFPPVCAIVRSSVIDRVGGFDQALGGCCDWDLWMRVVASGYSAEFLDRRLAYYRLHDESMSKALAHMKATAIDTLAKNMAKFPQQIAKSIGTLIETSEAVFSSKAALLDQVNLLQNKISDDHASAMDILRGKEWLEEHWQAERDENSRMKKRVKELEDVCLQHEQYIRELEAGKNWLEAQWKAQQRALREREHPADTCEGKPIAE